MLAIELAHSGNGVKEKITVLKKLKINVMLMKLYIHLVHINVQMIQNVLVKELVLNGNGVKEKIIVLKNLKEIVILMKL